MVAKIMTGKSISGALYYNEQKVQKGLAMVIAASGFPKFNMAIQEKAAIFKKFTSLNQRSKTNCVHATLNFSPKESLNPEQLFLIAREYINKLGFEGQPYIVYRHLDAAHGHLHIVTTNIQLDGKRLFLCITSGLTEAKKTERRQRKHISWFLPKLTSTNAKPKRHNLPRQK